MRRIMCCQMGTIRMINAWSITCCCCIISSSIWSVLFINNMIDIGTFQSYVSTLFDEYRHKPCPVMSIVVVVVVVFIILLLFPLLVWIFIIIIIVFWSTIHPIELRPTYVSLCRNRTNTTTTDWFRWVVRCCCCCCIYYYIIIPLVSSSSFSSPPSIIRIGGSGTMMRVAFGSRIGCSSTGMTMSLFGSLPYRVRRIFRWFVVSVSVSVVVVAVYCRLSEEWLFFLNKGPKN